MQWQHGLKPQWVTRLYSDLVLSAERARTLDLRRIGNCLGLFLTLQVTPGCHHVVSRAWHFCADANDTLIDLGLAHLAR